MIIPPFKQVTRKRKLSISYNDPKFVRYYDLDSNDLQDLVIRLKNGEELTDPENERYGVHILTLCRMVLAHQKFRNAPLPVKSAIVDEMYFELLSKLHKFDPSHGSSIFSYAYRIGYTAGIHYFKREERTKRHDLLISNHCQECLEEYLEEVQ